MPLTRSVSRGSSGSGRTRNSLEGAVMALQRYHMQGCETRKSPEHCRAFLVLWSVHTIAIRRPSRDQMTERVLRLTVQSAEQPDQEDDRQRNSNKPKQKAASHGVTSTRMTRVMRTRTCA